MVPSQPLVNSPSISPVPGSHVDSTQNYSESARVFLQSNTLAGYYQAAKGIVAEASACSDSGFLDKKLPHDLTYLHMACLVQDLGFLNRLLAMDECAEQLTQNCETIEVGEIALIDSKGDTDSMPAINGDTPLHFALFTGWAEGAVLLINRLKSDNQFENTVNGTGNSLLHLAAGNCPVGVVQLLVGSLGESGASEQINSQTNRGSTPLHSNVRTGKPDVGDWLLKNGGEKSILLRDEGERRPCDHLEKRLEKMKEALEELRQKSTESDQENLRMDKQSQEILAWEKILPKLDPWGQQEAAACLPSDMNALV